MTRPSPTDAHTLSRENDRNQLLLEVGHAVTSNLTLKDLFQTVSTCLGRYISHDVASIVLLDQESGELRVHALDGAPAGTLDEGIVLPMDGTPPGICINTRKTILRDTIDFEEFHAPMMRMAYAAGLRCGCSVPLISHDQILGSINVGAFHEAAFTKADVELLEQIADPVAIAVENALNFQRAKHERDRFQLMLKINNAVVSHLDLQELVKTISASLRDIIPHDAAGIALYEPEHDHLREYTNVFYTDLNAFRIGDTIPLQGTPAGQVFLTGQPLLIRRPNPDQYPEDRYSLLPSEASPKSACLVPLSTHGRKLGIAGVSSRQENSFTEKDLELFSHVTDQIAIAVENSLNFELANQERIRAQTLLEINNAITTNLDLHELIRATSACLRNYFKHDFAGMALYDQELKKLVVHTLDTSRPKKYVFEGEIFSIEGTLNGLAFTTGQPVVRNRIDPKESSWPLAQKFFDEQGLKSACFLPMISGGRTIGVFNLGCRREEAFSQADTDLLINIAGQVALGVQNSLQYRQIETLKNKLASEKRYLEEEIKTQYNFAEIVGQSDVLRAVLEQVETVAPTDSTVLLCGETGTGKELIARAIHNLSARHERTLVKLNCAAIPTGLLESELFGHEKGAFTGAVSQRIGRFELANKGTLLLDEIGEIPLDLQPKLLRVLQEHEFERLGSSRTTKTDARLIAATNCDLAQMVHEKRFRSDLFYRLNVFPILIPPLRERAGDIPLLVGYFAQKHAARMNKKIESVPTQTMEVLCRYRWPGNVRELENFIERSVILSRGSELQSPLAELQPSAAAASAGDGDGRATQGKPKLGTMDEMERAYIEEVLRHASGAIAGKGGAAEILGMPSSTLRSRMKKLGIKQ